MVNEQSRADDRIELEPVTCWPLIYAATGFVCLGILAVGGLALWNVLLPHSEPSARSVPTRPPVEKRPARVESVMIAEQPIVPIAAGRQVVVKREVVGYYSPLPPLSVTPPPPPSVAQPSAGSGPRRVSKPANGRAGDCSLECSRPASEFPFSNWPG